VVAAVQAALGDVAADMRAEVAKAQAAVAAASPAPEAPPAA